MPTPVGHALGGVAVYLAARNKASLQGGLAFASACLATSLLPDLDFAIGPFAGRSYHHYFSHSLGFAALFAVAAYLLARAAARAQPLRDAAILLAVYLSHIFLDLLAKDTSPPFGVQLFWPFSDTFIISPLLIFDDIWRGTLTKLFGPHNWWSVAREVAVLGPVCLAVRWRRRQQRLGSRGGAVSSP